MPDLNTQNFFALDLELNNKKDGSTPKIIQVGIAIASPIRPNDIQTYSWYLDPQEPITPFITELTGITDDMVKNHSVTHEILAEELGALIKDCFVNPVTWGGSGHMSDAEELKNEFNERNIEFPHFGRRILDVKTIHVFENIVKGKSPKGGLARSMRHYGLEFDGTPHRANDDAKNTLRFFFYYLNKYKRLRESLDFLKGF